MGQSIDIKHLAEYVDISRQKYIKSYTKALKGKVKPSVIIDLAEESTRKEVKAGVQTIQYQINTLMTTNGQAPFVTLFMHITEEEKYKDDLALIIKEILEQRIQGIKNEKGVYTTPAFPKLIYVLDENNVHEGAPYYYLTKLATQCTAKRLYPDYISAKVMRQNHEGNVYAPMGKWNNAAHVKSFEPRLEGVA